MKNPVVEVKNISFSYDKNVEVLSDISFSIEKGEHVCIVGHNGSGKSTLAQLICYLLTPTKGEIFVDGIKLDRECVNKVRSICGIVFQNPDNQFIGSTVEDDIAFGLENRNIEFNKMKELVKEFANKVGMGNYLDKMPSEISGGQKQRVAIAGVLALGLKLIIFDESTSMLDPKGVEEINNLVKKLKNEDKELTFISITHNIDEAYLADRVIVLNKGKIFKEGNPSKVFENEKELNEIGLDIPFVLKLKNKLVEKCVSFDVKSDDLDSLARSLCK